MKIILKIKNAYFKKRFKYHSRKLDKYSNLLQDYGFFYLTSNLKINNSDYLHYKKKHSYYERKCSFYSSKIDKIDHILSKKESPKN